MTLDVADWDEMVAEPEKLVVKLEEGLVDLQGQVRLMREQLKTARRLVEVKADVDYLRQYNAPRPKGRFADQAEEDDHQPEGAGEGTGLTRKKQVVQLLGQQPERHWKAAEIAELLEIDNLKSLRTSLDEFARSGVIRKNVDDKSSAGSADLCFVTRSPRSRSQAIWPGVGSRLSTVR
ncbi:hypothetical protein [Nocardia asiatica]|uniref:hypothetical protein n=1 Tax=Nocardia asiatica TaxID=209252 RepID=UPI0003116419|nr:hypothetical protein [Nocardia asiatica]